MVDFHIDVNSDRSDNVVEHDIVAWLYSRMKPGKNHTTAYHLEKARAQIAFSKLSFSVYVHIWVLRGLCDFLVEFPTRNFKNQPWKTGMKVTTLSANI